MSYKTKSFTAQKEIRKNIIAEIKKMKYIFTKDEIKKYIIKKYELNKSEAIGFINYHIGYEFGGIYERKRM